MDKKELQQTAVKVRKGIVTAVHAAKAGHPGGSLSAADIFTYLYFQEMNIDPKDPRKPDRDRFVLSKGHTAPGLYSAMANRGYFPVEELTTLRKLGSKLQGHPNMNDVPGIDMSSGSLGQGLSAADGMALAAKLDGKSYRVYCLCGDGELQEGQNWECIQAAAYYQLDNFIILIDANEQQVEGAIEDQMSEHHMSARFQSFGAECVTCNGHDIDSIIAACNTEHKGKPLVVICRTHGYTGVPPLKDKYPFLHFVRISEEEKPVYQAIYEEMMERSAAGEADAPADAAQNRSAIGGDQA